MKTFWLLASILVLVAAPSAASSLGFGVGYLDTEGAGDDNGAAVKFSLDAGPAWNLDLRVAFFDGHAFQRGSRAFEVGATPIDAGISYGFQAAGKTTAYVGGGVSYTLFTSDAFNLVRAEHEQSRIENEVGWYAVVGVEAPVKNRIGVFLEVLYRQTKPTVEGDGVAQFDAFPVDFAGVGGALGISFSW